MVASGREIGEFDKRNFRYDAERDCYVCSEGKILRYSGLSRKRKGKIYEIANKEDCLGCPNFGKCTTSKKGRKVMRLNAEELRERLEKEYALPYNQAIYKKRQQKAELVYGHIKRNLGVSSFLLRGHNGVRAEMSLLSVCFNLRRMITILGIKKSIEKLAKYPSHVASLAAYLWRVKGIKPQSLPGLPFTSVIPHVVATQPE